MRLIDADKQNERLGGEGMDLYMFGDACLILGTLLGAYGFYRLYRIDKRSRTEEKVENDGKY